MRVLISDPEAYAVHETAGDFHWTEEDEILSFSIGGPCRNACSCGCDRNFSGVSTGKPTTLGVVAELDEEEVRERVSRGRLVAGWRHDPDIEEYVLSGLNDIAASLDDLDLGDVVRVKNTSGYSELLVEELV